MRYRYVLSEVFLGLWRNVTMTIAMIITMAVSLTMLGASMVMVWQVDEMKKYYYDQIEVSIFLKKDVTDDQRATLESALKGDPLVDSVRHETREQAYENFKVMFRDAPDLVNSVKPDTLPEAYRVSLKNPEEYQKAADKYKGYAGISDIVDQQRLLGKIFGILSALQNMALVLALVQGVAALLLVANTIQVAAYSRRREVGVMKMVGASNMFIQAPFVLEAVFAGLIGAVLAFGALVAAKYFLIDGSLKVLTELLTPVRWSNIIKTLPLMAAVATLVNGITGWITLRFYLRV
jgi:cell division transport system permease protein